MRKTFNPQAFNALQNAKANLERLRAALVVQQQQDLENQKAILTQVQADYDSAQTELSNIDEDSPIYAEKANKVEEIALVMAITQENIAQYQMNLLDFGVEA